MTATPKTTTKCRECNGRGHFLLPMTTPVCDRCEGTGVEPDSLKDDEDTLRDIRLTDGVALPEHAQWLSLVQRGCSRGIGLPHGWEIFSIPGDIFLRHGSHVLAVLHPCGVETPSKLWPGAVPPEVVAYLRELYAWISLQ